MKDHNIFNSLKFNIVLYLTLIISFNLNANEQSNIVYPENKQNINDKFNNDINNKINIYQSFGPDDSSAFYFKINLSKNEFIITDIYGLDFEKIIKDGGKIKVVVRNCTIEPQKCIFQDGIIEFVEIPKDKIGSVIIGNIKVFDSTSKKQINGFSFSEPLKFDRNRGLR
jgi:hypothetical protein